MRKCVADKGQPPKHDEGSDNGTGQRNENSGKERRPKKLVVDEGRKQERIQALLLPDLLRYGLFGERLRHRRLRVS